MSMKSCTVNSFEGHQAEYARYKISFAKRYVPVSTIHSRATVQNVTFETSRYTGRKFVPDLGKVNISGVVANFPYRLYHSRSAYPVLQIGKDSNRV
jgi:hypothetical protein